jgi:major membrane immunogen (membrane-anchored lipoprotein)
MMNSVKMIQEGATLLYHELIEMVKNGGKMDLTDHVYGYVYDSFDDNLVETDILDLKVIDGKLYAFMDYVDSGRAFPEEDKLAMLEIRTSHNLPGWFALDEGFYGLRVQTLLSIAGTIL